MRSFRPVLYLAAFVAAFGAVPAMAQETQDPKPLVIEAENLMAGDERHQAMAEQGGEASALLPGDVVLYRLTFTNVTDIEVRNVVFNDPLPAGLRYVAESASADRDDVLIQYSIDGGKTYSARPMIEQVIDGERVERPAPSDMYTHIRWTVQGWVQPGAQVTAEFRAQLPDAAEAPEEPGQND